MVRRGRTDKDGIVPALLSAEITTRIGRDPAEIYRDLTQRLGEPTERRVQAAATAQQRARLATALARAVSAIPNWPAKRSSRCSTARQAITPPLAASR